MVGYYSFLLPYETLTDSCLCDCYLSRDLISLCKACLVGMLDAIGFVIIVH